MLGGSSARDRGAADALALVLLTPVAVALALLVVFLGRQVDSRAQVHNAAESAAQAAALARDPASAEQAAERAASALLVDADTCSSPTVSVDLTQFVPGGLVSVTVRCAVSQRGVEILGAPEAAFTATASATIDRYRSLELPP